MKRSYLEMFKFSSGHDILKNFSVTSRLWYQISTENELWHELLDIPAQLDLGPKATYRQEKLARLVTFMKTQVLLYVCHSDLEVCIQPEGDYQVSWNSAHTFIDAERVMVCGHNYRGGLSHESFIVNIKTRVVRQMESMNVGRVGHGLVAVGGVVYAFGGFGPLKTGEMWCEGLGWRLLLEEMGIPRVWFTPCVSGCKVYLCGGGRGPCESYDTSIDHFTSLNVSLDTDFHAACTAIYKQCLLILTPAHFTVYNLVSRQKAVVEFRLKKDVWSNSPAVVYQNKLIFQRDEQEKRVVCLSDILVLPELAVLLK